MNDILKSKIISINGIVSDRLKFLVEKYELSQIDEILDIGSWHLEQSIELNQLFPSANISAFEPVPESYQLCINKRQSNSIYQSKISIYNIALSDFVGKSKFYFVDPSISSSPNAGASSMLKFIDGLNGSFFSQVWNQTEIEVDCLTLDKWCEINKKDKIDLIWIDTQGTELNVFKGGIETLKKVKVILTEVGLKPYYHGHTLKKEIDEFLISLGFTEISESFELNGFDYEANTIYVNENNFTQG
jgi:FkbM family methyltransferase